MRATQDAPNYDIEIDADELLADLATAAADYGESYEEYISWWRESLDHAETHTEARHWAAEARGGQRAYSRALAKIQAGAQYRNDDGTVDVRSFVSWLSEQADIAHEVKHEGRYGTTRQSDEAEAAYVAILSTLRDGYGIGWPRLDDIGGNPLEEDLP